MTNKYTHHNTRERGQAVLIAVVLFAFGSFIFIGGITSTVLADIQEVNALTRSKKSFYVSEASLEDVLYRVQNALPVATTETLSIEGHTATTTVADISGGKSIVALGDASQLIRKSQVDVQSGSGVAFFYGMQSDEGGTHLKNNALVVGNVFSNGPITGDNNNLIKGDVISAGPNGLIDEVHATSSAYANNIQDATIEGDAYYQSISGSTVSGTLYPDSPDQATSTLPITDQQISDWETDAETGGVISSPCPYEIDSDTILGPVKITCDLIISDDPTVTLSGNIWVVGDIEIQNNAIVRVSPSLGSRSVVVIADNPADRLESSQIELKNNSIFQGSGTPGSHILFISQNNAAENGEDEEAIEVENDANGDLLVYAGHGEINIENNASIKEITAYKISAENNSVITYDSGLANLLFTGGASGGFEIVSWKEIE